MKAIKSSNNIYLRIICIIVFLYSCSQENRNINYTEKQNEYKDTLHKIFIECGLKQFLTKEDIALVDKNYNSLVGRNIYTYAYLSDSIFLKDKGVIFYNNVPEGSLFDYNKTHLVYFNRRGPDNEIHVYDIAKGKTTPYTFKFDIKYPFNLIIVGDNVVVADINGNHFFNLKTLEYLFFSEGSMNINTPRDQINYSNTARSADDCIYPYKGDQIIKSNHTFILQSSNKKNESYSDNYLSLLNVANKKIIHLDSSNQFDKQKGIAKYFSVHYYHDSLGLLYHINYNPPIYNPTLFRYDIRNKSHIWSLPMKQKELIVSIPFLCLAEVNDSITKALNMHFYSVSDGSLYKNISVAELKNDEIGIVMMKLFKNVLIMKCQTKQEQKNSRFFSIVIDIVSGKQYTIDDFERNAFFESDFIDKYGNYYWYVNGMGIYE